MRTRKLLRCVIGSVVALAMLAAIAGGLYHFRPLIASRSYVASVATAEQGEVPVKVYSMLGRPSWLFIRVPETHRELEYAAYRWFAVDTEQMRVAVSFPQESPFLHLNPDRPLGITLDFSAKLEDTWQVDFSGTDVKFSNCRLSVSMRHRDK
jgi:hypothetical protein